MPNAPSSGTSSAGYSGLDFNSVGAELSWWLNPAHITQYFKGGFPGSGENGIDIGLPHGTPVYAILPGKVVGAGFYGGGGVESIQYNSQNVIYYQHLDVNYKKVGDQVNAGDLIGLSGGQLSGGNHPATCCSGGDHIEVGINAPFGGIWNPNNVQPNNNPLPLLQSLLARYQGNDVATTISAGILAGLGMTQGASGIIAGLVGGGSNSSNGSSGHCFTLFPGGPQFCIPQTVYNWATQPIRFLKLVGGLVLIGIATLLVVVPVVAGPATEVAGAATGQPELIAAGAAISGARRRSKTQAAATHIARRNASAAAKTTSAASSAPPASSQTTQPAVQTEPPAKRQPVYHSGRLVGYQEPGGKITFISSRRTGGS